MNFGTAIYHLKNNDFVQREGWEGWIALSDLGIKSHPPYILYISPDETFSPWSPSHEDLLAEDWLVG